MPATKQNPLGPLPKFKRDGTDQDWSGRPTLWSDAADLPVAYLKPGLEALGPNASLTFHHVGSQANAQGMPVRRPNVLMINNLDGRVDTLLGNPAFISAADRLGLIVCSPPPAPVVDGTAGLDPGDFRAFIYGLPLIANPANPDNFVATPTDKYVGGRVLVIADQDTNAGLYLDAAVVTVDEYTAPDGGASCTAAGFDPASGPLLTASAPVLFVSADYDISQTFQSVIDADKLFLTAASARFDRFRLVINRVRFQTETQTAPIAMTCYNPSTMANVLVDPPDSPFTMEFTNGPAPDQIEAAWAAIVAQFTALPGGIVEADTTWGAEQIIQFFDED